MESVWRTADDRYDPASPSEGPDGACGSEKEELDELALS